MNKINICAVSGQPRAASVSQRGVIRPPDTRAEIRYAILFVREHQTKTPALCAILVIASAACAQTASPPAAPSTLEFEVASIHPSSPTKHGPQAIQASADGYTASYLPVKLMIALLYRIPARQVIGGPSWIRDDRYDVQAKTEAKYSLDDLDTMYKNLLADRFHLKFHIETKEENAFVLTIDKNGSKLKPTDQPASYNFPISFSGIGEMHGTHVSMPFFCWMLGQMLQEEERPVVDMTALTGFYDFNLSYLPRRLSPEDRSNLSPQALDSPSIFDALKQQLGLKLTAQKGPVQYLVIDHIDRPSEN